MLERATRNLRDALQRLRGTSEVREQHDAGQDRELSADALAAFGLERQPFHDQSRPDELFVDDAIEMQINMLAEQLRGGEVLPALRGEPGSGKTSLIIQLLQRVSDEHHLFIIRGEERITATRVVMDMLRVMVARVPDDPREGFRQLRSQLESLVGDGRPATLVIDDAHRLRDRELQNLLAVHDHLRARLQGGFRLLVAADPSIEALWTRLDAEQIRSGQVVTAGIRPLNRMRIPGYLAHRLHVAGSSALSPLDEDALDRISAAGGGLPRDIEAAAARELEDAAR